MKSQFTLSGKAGQVLFTLSLLIIFYLFDFQTKLFTPPHGIHFIRQTDCLSFVSNYYHHGFDFFSPQLFTLNNDNGKAVCEFPILYYITALLCLVAYEPVFILKLLTLTIVSIGFLYLFKLLQNLFHSIFYAWAFTLLFISSTILLHYSVNVLPDPAALGFTLIGWYHVFNFKNRCFAHAWGFGFFAIAALLKVTFFIYPIAAVLYLCFMSRKPGNSFSLKRILGIFFISLLTVTVWNLYVLYYNAENHAESFLLHAVPIWKMSGQEVSVVMDHVFNYWHSEYFYQTTQHVFFIITMLSIAFIRRMEKEFLFLWIILILGSSCFIILFFPQFKDHDYYFITLLPALILIVSFSFRSLRKIIPILLNTWLLKGAFLVICILSLNYAGKKMKEREQRPMDEYSSIACKLNDAERILDSLKISKNAKIIIYPDLTANGGLYMINRQGWGVSEIEEVHALESKATHLLLIDTNDREEFKFITVFPIIFLNP